MSRQEAAIIYLDRLLGFRGRYSKFTEATESLSENERSLIENAVFRRSECETGEQVFFKRFK